MSEYQPKPAISSTLTSIRGNVEPFYAMDILSAANKMKSEGSEVKFLCVGQPAAPAPAGALDAARKMLERGVVSYTDAAGREDLKSRLARHLADRYGVSVAPERIFITTGSSAGFNLAFLTLFNPGDRIAVAAPGYPAYRNIIKVLSLEAVEIQTDESSRWVVTPKHIEQAHASGPIDGILVASPANPTGTMMTPLALKELVECCERLNIRFISDEIYHGLTYQRETGIRESSALEFGDNAIVINSFSKYFCMTGWRVGWMVLPEELMRPVERLAQSLYISAPELSQIAALHALDCTEELDEVLEGYRKNRSMLLDRLPQIGFERIMPIDGAFYAYADVSRHSNNSMEFAKTMLQETGVAATPGLDFDLDRGPRYMRFSFAGDQATMEQALDRLQNWLK